MTTNPIPASSPTGADNALADNALRVRLPFVSTSFATDLRLYTLLWPLWWLLGADQLLLPLFILYEFIRFLLLNHWQVRINTAALLALALAIWWVVPVFWVDPEVIDVFLKESASIWAQFLILVLFWNCVKTAADWRKVLDSLTLIALYTVVASVIFVSGVWRGEFTSLIGRALPESMIAASSFFTSISFRAFGESVLESDIGLFTLRLNALTLSFSALSMVCLLLIPLMYWRLQTTRGLARLVYLGLLLGLVLALALTESRIAYAAFLVGIVFYALLRLHAFRSPNRPLTFAVTLAAMGIALVAVFLVIGFIIQWFQSTFVDLRPGSWLVRMYIYVQTLALLPEHPIAGWGAAVHLPDMPSDYSAGTHSSYLGMLFQHGIIGLLAYLGLWLSMWLVVLRGLRARPARRSTTWFWAAMATAFLFFNLREVADTWWWDQLLLYVVWLMWGLVLTAKRALPE
jgi:O-antigen ligase